MDIRRMRMAKKYSIAEARDNLPGVVHEVERGTRVELTRRGKPVAVLLGLVEYERLAQGRRDFWDAYQEFRREFDLATLGIEPDEIFHDVRDASPGREFSW
jgi:prevent-host-death family protein